MYKTQDEMQNEISHAAPLNTDVVAQRVGDSLILLHLKSNRFYELNSTAARLWELLGEGCALTEIHQRLRSEFDVNDADLDRNISGMMNSLQKEGLINGE
jgi:hypothetical protein